MENKQLLDIAKKAALIASNFLKKSHDSKEVLHDIIRDVKIKGDKESEKLIIDFLTTVVTLKLSAQFTLVYKYFFLQ